MKKLYESNECVILWDMCFKDAYNDPFFIRLDLMSYRLSFWKEDRNYQRTRERVGKTRKVRRWVSVSDIKRDMLESIQSEFSGLPFTIPGNILVW